jgi:hypothetical protein
MEKKCRFLLRPGYRYPEIAVANSALIAQVAGKLGKLRGFDSDSGLMTQEAFFRVTDVVTGKISLPATLGTMLASIDAIAGLRSLNVERLLLRGKPYIAGQGRGDLLFRAFVNGRKQI